jgi:hypothetical protein
MYNPARYTWKTDTQYFKLKQKEKNLFTHEFVNVQRTTPFHFNANGFKSKDFTLTVTAKPVVTGFEIDSRVSLIHRQAKRDYQKRQVILVVPYGTRLSWRFDARNTDESRSSNSGALSIRPSAREMGSLHLLRQHFRVALMVSRFRMQK